MQSSTEFRSVRWRSPQCDCLWTQPLGMILGADVGPEKMYNVDSDDVNGSESDNSSDDIDADIRE